MPYPTLGNIPLLLRQSGHPGLHPLSILLLAKTWHVQRYKLLRSRDNTYKHMSVYEYTHTHVHTHTNCDKKFHSLTSSLSPLSRLQKTFNPQPVLHPVPSGTQSPSSASRTASASSLVGWPPPPHPLAVDFALHGVRSCVWTPRVVKTSRKKQH